VLAVAGFGYCAAASQSFVREAAACGADVRFSEAVTDLRMQDSGSGARQVAGEMLIQIAHLTGPLHKCTD